MTRPASSGAQFEISHGDQHATVVEVGGGLRQYRSGDREILDGYGPDERCTGARGLPLVPWPNRIADGKYRFDGSDYQLPLTEPDKHNAIHGLVRWRNWSCRARGTDHVAMGTVLRPMMGYPFTLDVEVEYRLGPQGLTVQTTATNMGDAPCPYAAGQHPYLAAQAARVDTMTLQLDAAQWLPTDERGLPIGTADVAGSPVDFRDRRVIGSQDIDYTFTDLTRDSDGLAWVNVTDAEGHSIAVWVDQHYPYIEIYTSHTQPEPHWRTGLGVEPMTAPPNAFRTGDDVVRLEPGQSMSSRWGIRNR
ncbi:aldose 1-epimerase family protein [Mycolicibacterium sp. P1-5]|uniref:aldose 1-epimerase family protein n=1 Tax=Mycolicibacterium sp. P1-5 TaxID=2024617 RepID=UPI0011ECA895|nr:aldose 1-epimerase family protein [Mycolicibacterium sp. P1-5]KAA0108359.1 aldose epimerase [Mycolicibacterium sp. P1-5]